LLPKLVGDIRLNERGFSAVIRKTPHAPEGLVAVFHAYDPSEAEPSLKEMYKRQFFSDYVFQGGRLPSRSLQENGRGIRVRLADGLAETTQKEPPGMIATKPDDRHGVLVRP